MKILFINSVYNWGSTGKIVHALFTSCEAEGIDAAVGYGRTMTAAKSAAEKNVYKFGLDWETKLHALLTRITGRTGCFSFFSTRRLLRFMEEFQPDVVNLHEPHAYFLNLKPFFRYLKKHHIPLVYTFHCEFAYTGKCGFSLGCDGWKTGCGNCPHLREYPASMFFDKTASMFREKKELLSSQNLTIVCPSGWLADRAEQSFLASYPVKVIPNGIDTENVFFRRNSDRLREKLGCADTKIILAVAPDWADPRKGAEHLVKLAERFQGENVKMIFVGKNADKFAFPGNVIRIGRTEDQRELAEYYSMADVFVICSSMENLPTTCLEAVCCGAPVAGFDVGGTAETAPGETGRFGKYGDMDALEENVRHFLSFRPDAELFEELRKKYSLEEMCRQYQRVYREILSPSKEKRL